MLKVLVAMREYVLCCVMDIHSEIHLNSIASLLSRGVKVPMAFTIVIVVDICIFAAEVD